MQTATHQAEHAPRARELSTLTVNEFCQQHRIGRTKFYAEVNSGELSISKIGRKTIITPEQQLQWLRRKSQGARVMSEISPARRKDQKRA
ncbi:MAG: hypothetical protein CME38_11670 [Haliea sp.]|nr:hypothetical protein [Haliea sp.]|tara:strand:- start:760 stop:1029 length:270 start_codon:yes stop_codon:yes gene_type:complete